MQDFDHKELNDITPEQFRGMMMKAQALAFINYFIGKVIDTALTVIVVIAICRYAGIDI